MRLHLANFGDDDLVLVPGDAAGLEFVPLAAAVIGHGQADVVDLVHFQTGQREAAGDVFDGQAVEVNEVFKPGDG